MDSGFFAQASACPGCGNQVAAGARCPSCTTTAADRATFANPGTSVREAQSQARAFGNDVGQRVKSAWAVHEARAPLVALTLTLIGVFLPWFGGFSVTQLLGWQLPVVAAAIVAVSLVLYATTPNRPGWLGITAGGVSFVIAVSACLMLVTLLVLTHAIADLEDALAHLGSLADSSTGGAHLSVGIGAWITTASAVVLFISVLRLVLTTYARS
jgi:hypothetical protein